MNNTSGNYPLGAECDPCAPWNEEESPEREVEVVVSLTLSKTMKVKVTNYEIDSGIDEDGNPFEELDFSDCALKSAIEEQFVLPQNAYEFICEDTKEDEIIKENLRGWAVDDFEVILE